MKSGLKYLVSLLVVSLLASCDPDEEPSDKTLSKLAVTEITPDRGPKNTIVKIFGTGFSLVPSDNQVTLNGKPCSVNDAFGEMLTIVVPSGAGSGKFQIETAGKKTETAVFHYTYTEVNVVTIAGSIEGFKDGSGSDAQFKTPVGVTTDTLGNTYVTDQGNHKIRKIDAVGTVTTIAGSVKGYSDGTAQNAQFNLPTGIVFDETGNLIITDAFNDKVRKISSSGIVTTVAGSTTGYKDGDGSAAQFNVPYGIAMMSDGTYAVGDYLNNRIRKVTPSGYVTTLAGNGIPGFGNGVGANSYFYYPAGLSSDQDGNIYVADQFNHRIRMIHDTEVSTRAGSGPVGEFNNGYADGPAATSRLAYPTGVCFNTRDSTILVADSRNHRIRIISGDEIKTLVGGYGYADGAGSEARFNGPSGVAVDREGNIIVADSQNHRIRKIIFE